MLKGNLVKLLARERFYFLERQVIELNDHEELKKVFGWQHDPILDDPILHDFDYVEDVNGRRLKDAASIGLAVRNCAHRVVLEIGTAEGHTTALMAANAPQATVHTLNIPPEEIQAGEGGKLITVALEKERIGCFYRERGLSNVRQIYANSARWQPDIGPIDIAFIDGCHDASFVYNDSLKVLGQMKPGSLLLWHDFNLDLVKKFGWIDAVCSGVERLCSKGHLKGRIFHVRDSWVGIYEVPPR